MQALRAAEAMSDNIGSGKCRHRWTALAAFAAATVVACLALLAFFAGPLSEAPSSAMGPLSVTFIVDGMMKSRSGAT